MGVIIFVLQTHVAYIKTSVFKKVPRPQTPMACFHMLGFGPLFEFVCFGVESATQICPFRWDSEFL